MVTSIRRYDPGDANTDSQTLVYRVTFSEDVRGVDRTDFVLSPNSTGGPSDGTSPVTRVRGFGTVYYVTVSASQDGTYNLDLVSSGHDINDIVNYVPLTNTVPTEDDQTYTVGTAVTDSTAPTLASIARSDPSGGLTSESTLVFEVTFSEAVQNVDASDFELSGSGAGSITVSEVSGDTYNATVAVNTDGTFNLDIAGGHDIEDLAGTGLSSVAPTGADQSYTVDRTAPAVTSIVRSNPVEESTTGTTLVFAVTFSESVTGVDQADFVLSTDGTGSGSVTGLTGSGSAYSVTVTATADGTFNLDLASSGHGIADTASNPLTDTAPTGTDHTYTVSTAVTDNTAPTLASIERSDPSGGLTSESTLVFEVTFSEAVQNVDASDFELSGSGAGSITVSEVSGDTYNATVAVNTDGTFNLDIAGGHDIEDLAGTGLSSVAPTGADQSYTVDRTAPAVTSIVRSNPVEESTTGTTLVFAVTFSESVTGVDQADFVLSTDGTGSGSVTGLTGSGSAYSVTVTATADGTFNLDLASSGHGIADTASNPLTDTAPTGTDHTYTVSTAVTDNTAPTLASIERSNPSSATTNSQTLIYKVTFSEDVTGVDQADFELSDSSTGTGSITVSEVSGDTYNATVAVNTDGTFNLDIAGGHDIEDLAGTGLSSVAPTGADQSYTVDRTAPAVTSIVRSNPVEESTTGTTLVFAVTFSESVTGVDQADFVLSTDGTGSGSVTGLTGSGSAYSVTVTATADGTFNLDLASSGHGIADTASNPLTDTAPTGTDHTYTVSTAVTDNTAPTLASIERSNPSSATTNSQTLIYKVTFSEDVTGVDQADFELSDSSTGTGSITVSEVSGDTYNATVAVNTDGTFNLDIAGGHDIEDLAGTGLSSVAPTGADQSYTVDRTAPAVTSIVRSNPVEESTTGTTLVFAVTFSESVTGVDQADFVLSTDGTGSGSVTGLTGSGSAYSVTVTATADGTFNLDLASSGHGIADTASNPLTDTAPTGTDHTYTVSTAVTDNTAPTLASIERSNPSSATTNSQTLIYKVTFSEDVTGVDQADFELSDSSTGTGSITVSEVSGDTYNATVAVNTDGTFNLDIAGGHDIEDLAGTGLSSVAPTGADQSYTVDRTAPAVTSIVRSNPVEESTTGTTLVFAVTFSESVTGVDQADFVLSTDGTGSGSVTGLTGSGSAYSVTVTATADGTFNLDLASSGHGIADTASNPLTDTAPTGTDHTYTVSTAVTDNTAPTLASIERSNPSSATTNSQTLIYKVTFSEDVTGVDQADFELSDSSTGTGSITVSEVSGDTYNATVAVNTDGTFNLDIAGGHDIEDLAGTGLSSVAPTGADQSYTVDRTAPAVTSIVRSNPVEESTTGTTLVFAVTFSESVTGVDQADFVLSTDGTGSGSVTGLTGSGSAYSVTVTATADGTFNLDLASSGHGIADTASNPLTDTAPTGTDHTYTVSTAVTDNTAPTLASIERSNPSSATTNSQTLIYKVTFSEDVTGVDQADFELSDSSTGTGSITVSEVSGDTYNATVAVNTDGTFNLDIAGGHDIEDLAGTGLSSVAPTGADQSYTVDRTAPAVTSIVRSNPVEESTTGTTLVFAVTFSESVTGVDQADFVLSTDGTGSGSVTGLTGSGSAYSVTVTATADGTFNLDLASSGHGIADTASNPLTDTAPTGTDHTYTVSTAVTDNTAPTLASIERSNPSSATTNSQTLIYKVTFSEDVTGVDQADFELSDSSTGTGSITVSRISDSTYNATVAVDMDGTFNLDMVSGHGVEDAAGNPLSGTTPAEGTDESYTVNLTAPAVASIERSDPTAEFTIKITLVFAVTFSEDVTGVDQADFVLSTDGTGTGSVTGLTGSGSAYNVTVTATADGTFNLNIASGHDIENLAGTGLSSVAPTGADQSYTVDRTAPAVASIERSDPSGELTSESTLVFGVTFSEAVQDVDATDFELSGSGAGSITVSEVSGDTYNATVAVNTDGTFNLDIAGGHDIEDLAGTGLSSVAPTGADQSYTVDRTAPAVASIERSDPSGELTSESTLVFEVTFSEAVQDVDATDFELSGSGAGSITVSEVSGDTYNATVAVNTDGTFNLDIAGGHDIEDLAGTGLSSVAPTGADQSYTVDRTAPAVASIEGHSPTAENTDSQTLVYKVAFSEDVTGVDTADFVLSPGSTEESTSTNTYVTSGQVTQTRSPALAIHDLQTVSDTITISDSGTATSVSVTIDIEHTFIGELLVELIAPDGTARTLHDRIGGSADDIVATYTPSFGNISVAGNWILQINDNDNDDPGILNSWTLTVDYNTTTTVSPVDIIGSGSVYYVIVPASQNGTYNLDLVSSGHGIADTASNPLTNTIPTTGTDHTYTVSTAVIDITAPALASIEGHSPTAENTDSQTLVYKVTFSEDVTGVDTADFVLSPGSTGESTSTNTNTYVTSEQFMQTRSPALAIPDLQTVSDIITVSDSGTATSVSVTIDIEHTFIGDLLVELIAPDGTARTLHDRIGGSTDDIVATYTPSFGNIPIAGNWTLQIDDDFNDDPGILNSWTLTVNYNTTTTTTTISPVTGITGSGSVYYAIVSASQNGTYNLVLVSSGHGIADTASNPLTSAAPITGTDHTYTVSTAVIDITAPTLASIERSNPSSATTDSQTLVYKVTFSEDVTGVDTADFVLSPGSTGGAGSGTSPVAGITGSGSVYNVTVSASQDGTYNLDLVSSGHGIADTASNPLTNTVSTTGTDHTYTVSIAPTLASIERSNPSSATTDIQTLVYKVTFSEDVTGVDTADFVLSPGSTEGASSGTSPVAGITGSGSVYDVTARASQDGTYNLVLVSSGHGIADTASNPLTNTVPTTGTDHTYTVSIVPTLASIERHRPTAENTDELLLVYKVTFSEKVRGVDKTDFVLSPGSTGGPSDGTNPVVAIAGSGSVYRVKVIALQDGTYNLDLVSSGHGIADTASNPLTNTVPTTGTDHTYTIGTPVIDSTAPALASIERYHHTDKSTDKWVLFYAVTFSEDVMGVDIADFVLSPSSTGRAGDGTSTVVLVGGSGRVYDLLVRVSQNGTYNLDLVSSGHGIADTASNPLTNTVPTTGTDHTYTVERVD